MDTDGFTYLTDGDFFGRVRGSVPGTDSGRMISATCVLTRETRHHEMINWREISREEAEAGMTARRHDNRMRKIVEERRAEELGKFERDWSLKAHGFTSRQQALIACVVLQYVTGEEPKLLSPADEAPPYSSYPEQDLHMNGYWVVLSSMYLGIAHIILIDGFNESPPVTPWWWGEVDFELTPEYAQPLPVDFFDLVQFARDARIIRRNGEAIARDLPEQTVKHYWDELEERVRREREEYYRLPYEPFPE
jgi:hypothetical protein